MRLFQNLGTQSQVQSDRERLIDLGRDEAAYVCLLAFGVILWISGSQAISIALLIGGVLISVWSPVAAFWACCAAIPFVYHPIAIGKESLTLLEIGLIATGVGIVGRMAIERMRFSFAMWANPVGIHWAWLGAISLIIAGALAIAFQPETGQIRESFRTFRWVIIEGVVAFGAARYALVMRGGERIVLALAIPAAGISLWAIAEVVFRRSGFEADGIVRATASYLHPNNLALYLLRVFTLLCGAAALANRQRVPRHWLAVTALSGMALAVTLSRGAIFGATAGMLIVAWFARRRIVFMAVGVILVSVPVAFLLLAQQRFLGSESSGIGETRREIWSSAIEMIRDHPVSGIGLDQFLYQHNPRYIDPSAWSERYISHPHNIVLDSWLSLGLPGLLLLIAATIALSRQIIRISRNRPSVHWWPAAATAALTAGFAHSLVDNGFFLPDLAAMTWILIGLSLGPVCSGRLKSFDGADLQTSETGHQKPERHDAL